MKIIFSIFCLALLTGCSSTNPSGDKPVRYASSVQVTPFGPLPSQPSPTIEVFQTERAIGNRPYHIIALLTREAFPRDEGLITSALIWRAQHIGANGIILLGSAGYTGQDIVVFRNFASSTGGQTVFRANAIVFDN